MIEKNLFSSEFLNYFALSTSIYVVLRAFVLSKKVFLTDWYT
ncbi:hypothetical protein HMPREF1063_01234 [Phocaeicola dorei CL02T00C15]|nr:hypothetical protein HMPREF1063_01234 [Phocaeicola dorei CL02T00C15]